MVRPRVDSRLQNIEHGISEIKNKLCEISPCKAEDVETNLNEESEE